MADHLDTSETLQVKQFGLLMSVTGGLAFAVMVLGSLVRATNSGLACPDWPLCYEQLVPAFDYQIFLEWFHRLVAAFLAFATIYGLVQVFRKRVLRNVFGLQLGWAVLFLFVQIILGGLTVLHLLEPKIVSLHLINATIFVSIIFWIATKAHFMAKSSFKSAPIHPLIKNGSILLAALVFCQLFLGGMVSTNHAGLVCPDFPTCHGTWWWTPYSFIMALQQSHRYLAFTIFAVSIALAIGSTMVSLPKPVRYILRALPWVVLLQGVIGVYNVYYGLPVWASVLHLANALIIYVLAFFACLLSAYYAKGFENQVIVSSSERASEQLTRPQESLS